jgi:cytochrome c
MHVNVSRLSSVRARVGGSNRPIKSITLAVVFAFGHSALSPAAGDPVHGAMIYRQCMLCHSLDKNEIGPRHRNVFGRKAGSVADYDYSAALKASNIVWNETTLEQWLTSPQALVPGTKMTVSLSNEQDRADVIAFLKEKAGSEPSGATPGTK